MLFNSLFFLVFFTVVAVLYWALPGKYRWVLLILASLFFYGVFIPEYTAILGISVLMNYAFGLWIGRTDNAKKRRRLLVWGIVLNIAMLAVFKYANVLTTSLLPLLTSKEGAGGWIPGAGGWIPGAGGWIIPLGISFFTFTNLSYLIEVKRRRWEPERHLGYFTVFVTFFPKLIQGPIERPQSFMPQVKEPRVFDYDRTVSGLRLMLWGFFKKLVIADRLAIAVNAVFDNPQEHSGPTLIVAAIFYSFQIYFDFSGYIDIARGAGKILGFDLSRNFNLPYLSRSVKEFWDRWHITFSTWLRDYIFLPVAFSVSRALKKNRYAGIRADYVIYAISAIATFTVCGLWHGTGWNYLIWGELFAVYLIVANLTEKAKRRFYKRTGISKRKALFSIFQVTVTFLLITFAWIFFRAGTAGNAVRFLSAIPHGWGELAGMNSFLGCFVFQGFSAIDLALVVFAVPFVETVQYLYSEGDLASRFRSFPVYLRWVVYYAILLAIFVFGKFDSQTFIYFQF